MTAYRLYCRHNSTTEAFVEFVDETALALYILHNQRILRDEYRIMPKPEAVRLEVEETTT